MNNRNINLIVGAVLSGQRSVMVGSIEVSWKPLKENLPKKEREQQAERIARINIEALQG